MNNQPDYNNGQDGQNSQFNSFWQNTPNQFFGGAGAPNGYNAGAGRGSEIFKDKLFLPICILLSVAALINFPSFNILTILIAIGTWILYAAVRSNKNPFSTCGIKMISGTVKAQFILLWVAVAFLLILAIILLAIAPGIQSSIDPNADSLFDAFPDYITIDQETQNAVNQFISEFFPGMSIAQVFELFLFIAGIILAFAAIVLTVINLVFTRPLRAFLVSFGQNAPMGLPIARANYVRICLMVFAILQFISSASSLLSLSSDSITELISGVCTGVSMLLGSLLIGKYCMNQTGNTQTF